MVPLPELAVSPLPAPGRVSVPPPGAHPSLRPKRAALNPALSLAPGGSRGAWPGEGAGRGTGRWAAGAAAGGRFLLPPPAPTAGSCPGGASWGGIWEARGDAGGGSGARAAAGPRASRDSLGRTAAAGAEFSQAGWLPAPDIFGKFQQKQFRSFQKTGRWEQALFCLPPALFFFFSFLIRAVASAGCPTPRSPTQRHPPVPAWPRGTAPQGYGAGADSWCHPLGRGTLGPPGVPCHPQLCPPTFHPLQGAMSPSSRPRGCRAGTGIKGTRKATE